MWGGGITGATSDALAESAELPYSVGECGGKLIVGNVNVHYRFGNANTVIQCSACSFRTRQGFCRFTTR